MDWIRTVWYYKNRARAISFILAVFMCAVLFAVWRRFQETRLIASMEASMKEIRTCSEAVEGFAKESGRSEVSFAALCRLGYLESPSPVDAWGRPLGLVKSEYGTLVISAGADGRIHTDDDFGLLAIPSSYSLKLEALKRGEPLTTSEIDAAFRKSYRDAYGEDFVGTSTQVTVIVATDQGGSAEVTSWTSIGGFPIGRIRQR